MLHASAGGAGGHPAAALGRRRRGVKPLTEVGRSLDSVDLRLVIRTLLPVGVGGAEWAGTCQWRRGLAALGLVLPFSACQGVTAEALFPEECRKEPASEVASAWAPSYEGAIPDVIPALPPRDEPQPPSPGDAGGADDYPPPDLVPAPGTTAPTAARPEGNASSGATPAASEALDVPEVIAALPTIHLPTRQGHRLLAIDPKERPYKVNVPRQYVVCGEEYVSQIRICVSEAGLVSSMWILKHSIPVIDLQLPAVVLRWRYEPYLVDGRATAFCYPLNYRVR